MLAKESGLHKEWLRAQTTTLVIMVGRLKCGFSQWSAETSDEVPFCDFFYYLPYNIENW